MSSADQSKKQEEQQKTEEKKVVLNYGSIRRPHNRVLVTGGAGFVGSHLIDRLLSVRHLFPVFGFHSVVLTIVVIWISVSPSVALPLTTILS